MVYKLSWGTFDGTKKLLIGSGGDLVRTNEAGDPSECCCGCSPDDFSDDFSAAKGEWETSGGSFSITGGRLRDSGGVGVQSLCRTWPAAVDGTVVTVEAKIYKASNGQAGTGVATTIGGLAPGAGGTRVAFAAFRNGFNSDYRTSDPSGQTTIMEGVVSGDTLKIELENAGGASDYDIRYYINGVLKHTSSGVTLWPGATEVYPGVFDGAAPLSSMSEWDDFSYASAGP